MVALAIEEAREAADCLLDAIIIEEVGNGIPACDRVEAGCGNLLSSVGGLLGGRGGNESGSYQ